MKKILEPKVLATTTIITTIIGLILSIISSALNNPLYLRTGQIMGNIGSFVFGGSLYIIIYLLIILKKKQKNIKLLNTILFINLIIATLFYLIRQILNITDIYRVATITNIDNMVMFKIFFSLEADLYKSLWLIAFKFSVMPCFIHRFLINGISN